MTTPLLTCACIFEPFPELSSIATELTLELTDCCVRVLVTLASQRVSVCILNLPRRFFHRPNGTLCAAFFGLQGGGVYVYSNGVANFESCNIYDNTAASVQSARLLNPLRHFLQFPANRTHV